MLHACCRACVIIVLPSSSGQISRQRRLSCSPVCILPRLQEADAGEGVREMAGWLEEHAPHLKELFQCELCLMGHRMRIAPPALVPVEDGAALPMPTLDLALGAHSQRHTRDSYLHVCMSTNTGRLHEPFSC